MLPILALDSSTTQLSIAVHDANGIVHSVENIPPLSHDEFIQTSVIQALVLAKCRAEEISAVILGSGPGSFTGLRIGFAFIQGYIFARKVPLFLADSLAAAALGTDTAPAGATLVLADARRNEFFCALVEPNGNVLQEAAILKADELPALSKQSKRIVSLDQHSFIEAAKLQIPVISIKDVSSAKGLLRLYQAGKALAFKEHLSELKPKYLRAVAAKTIAERRLPSGL